MIVAQDGAFVNYDNIISIKPGNHGIYAHDGTKSGIVLGVFEQKNDVWAEMNKLFDSIVNKKDYHRIGGAK